jgi:putative ABC transport system permease protein
LVTKCKARNITMLKNYFKITFRTLLRNKTFSFLNIFGLAIGLAACLLIFEYIKEEVSYDRFNKKADYVYRVDRENMNSSGSSQGVAAHTEHGLGPVLVKDYPEVKKYSRLHPLFGGGLITYFKGADVSEKKIVFKLYEHLDADSVTVAGDFNNWNIKEKLLTKIDDHWETSVMFAPGEYEYKFFVDSKDLLDPQNPNTAIEGNKGQYINNVLKVDFSAKDKNIKEITRVVEKAYYAEPSLFDLFTFPMVSGSSAFLDQPNTVLVSRSFASRFFGKEDPLEKVITLDGRENYIVKGVFEDIPENSHLRFELLFSFKNILARDQYKGSPWDWSNFYTYVLLRSDASAASLNKRFSSISTKYFPGEDNNGSKTNYVLEPITKIHLESKVFGNPESGGDIRNVYFMVIIALFILGIAFVNHINLSTVKSIERSKEVGVRKVNGATRFHLIRQFLIESFSLYALGLVLALILVSFLQPLFNSLVGKDLSFLSKTDSTFWFIFIAVFVSGSLLSGLYPAFVISSFEPIKALKGKITPSGFTVRKLLVVIQFAISIALIIGTFAVYTQLQYMKNRKLGFNIDQTLVVLGPRKSIKGFPTKLESLKNELLRIPSIKSFVTSSNVPGKGFSWMSSGIRKETDPPEKGKMYNMYWADYNYIPTYQLKLIAGRNFSEKLKTDEESVIINNTAVKNFEFKSAEEAVGKKINIEDKLYTITGVLEDYHHGSLKNHIDPIIIFPSKINGSYYSIKVSSKNMSLLIAEINKQWESIFPGSPFEYFFLDEEFNRQYKTEQQFGKVFTVFTILAIIVACLGLFGLSIFTTSKRTKEIGVRKVLGSKISSILVLLSKDFIKLILIAFVVAVPIVWFFISKWLENYAYHFDLSWWLFAIPGVAVVLVALVTISYQTIKTARENPVKALRYE